MAISIKPHLRATLPRDLLLDLEDRVRAEASKAFKMIRDHSGLHKKRAREAEGQARFRMMEQGFEEVCVLHGGHPLDGGVIPNTELKVFQPFMRFDIKGKGVILGLAAMSDPKAVPLKNKSRLAGVTLNYHLSPRFNFDGKEATIGDIFGLLLVSRDREKAGQIAVIAVGIINSKYETYLFYEPLASFLSEHGGDPVPSPPTLSPPQPSITVSLKKGVKRFVPPETPDLGEDSGNAGKE